MYALEIENLTYTYPDQTAALKGVFLKIKAGKKTALLGVNGSGKTTLIYHLNGLLKARQGTVKVFGRVIDKEFLLEARKEVGLLFDNPDNQLFATTVFRDIAFGLHNLGLREEEVAGRANQVMERLKIKELADKPPFALSLGQKKKAAVAGLLAMEPRILVCDEPFAGLDPMAAGRFRSLLDELVKRGFTLFYSTHDVDSAYAWADEVAVMKDGSILGCGDVGLLEDERLMKEACLPVPVLARLFKNSSLRPRTIEEALLLLEKRATGPNFSSTVLSSTAGKNSL